MKKDWIWVFVFLIILILVEKFIFLYKGLDVWKGIGLYLHILILFIALILGLIWTSKKLRTQNQIKDFEQGGIYIFPFVSIVMVVASILLTLGVINKTVPLIFSIGSWIIYIVFIILWIKVKKIFK